jgi:FkbM family methyltransferase
VKKFRPQKVLRRYLRKLVAHANTGRDERTGFLRQTVKGHKVFLKERADYITPKMLEWLANEIYFKLYLPSESDTVVDIGAGLGHEAVWLGATSGTRNYIGVEIQPTVYECLCNTMHESGFRHQAFSCAISSDPEDVFLVSSQNYQIKSTLDTDGCVRVPTVTWRSFLDKFKIDKIDLLKINIEGGERFLLPSIGDYSMIRRIVVSAHDFRANAGEGEHFRTREFVTDFLNRSGFSTQPVGKGWLGDWIFAENKNL